MSHCYNWAKCRAHWSDHWYSTWLKWNKSRPGLWQTAATIFRKKSEETNNPSRNQPIRNYLCCALLGRGEEGPATCSARGWSRQWYWQDQAGGRTWDLCEHSSPVTAISFLSSMEGNLSTGWTGWGRTGEQTWQTVWVLMANLGVVLSVMSRWLSCPDLSSGKLWVVTMVPGHETQGRCETPTKLSLVYLPPFQPDKPYKPHSQNTNWHRLTLTYSSQTCEALADPWVPGWAGAGGVFWHG